MWHSRDIVFALKCQIYTPPLCSSVYSVCCTTSPFCPRKGRVSCGLSSGAYFLAFPAERMRASSDAIGWKRASGCSRPASPQDCPCWLRSACQALCSCRARRQQRGLCLCCRKPDSAAKSSSCLQGLLEKPSAGIPLGWEQSLPDVLAGSLRLRTALGQGTLKGVTSRIPGSLPLEGVNKVQGFVFSFLPYPGVC